MLNKIVVFATHNQHKVAEAQQLLARSSIHLRYLDDYPELSVVDDIPETGATFKENAQQKVDFVRSILDMSYVADDSGLEVRALQNQPGVHSKRWIPGSDNDRNLHLLELLKSVEDRTAQFVTVLAYYDSQFKQYHFFEGVVTGHIASEQRGTNGFGYDPLFIPAGYSQTFAELGDAVKNTVSHRARAFQAFKTYLEEY